MAAGTGSSRLGVGRHSSMAEINVTPLVDVMLVLLIISMVASPMLQRGINLELPTTESASEIQEARIVVSVDREARVRINERPVHIELLHERMKSLALTDPETTVFLRADKLLPYGEVLLVMDKIRTAGIHRVALVTVPPEPPSGR